MLGNLQAKSSCVSYLLNRNFFAQPLLGGRGGVIYRLNWRDLYVMSGIRRTCTWHLGHEYNPCFCLVGACLSRHSLQNVLSRTGNDLGFSVSIHTNRTFYMSFEVFTKAPCRQKHIRLLFAALRKPNLN